MLPHKTKALYVGTAGMLAHIITYNIIVNIWGTAGTLPHKARALTYRDTGGMLTHMTLCWHTVILQGCYHIKRER